MVREALRLNLDKHRYYPVPALHLVLARKKELHRIIRNSRWELEMSYFSEYKRCQSCYAKYSLILSSCGEFIQAFYTFIYQ
jgi:hypothetical protein